MKKTAFAGRLIAAAVFLYMLAVPGAVSDSARSGLDFCAEVLIPSLFVYMVLSDLFAGVASFFPNAAFPYVTIISGVLCGSPSGADSIRRIYENGGITKRQAECLVAVCGNASASFVISFAGAGVLGSVRAGVIILALKTVLSFAAWAVLSRTVLSAEERRFCIGASFGGGSLPAAVRRASAAMMNICACAVLFTVAADMASPICGGNSIARCLLRGALEFSGGIGECRSLAAGARYVCVCALIGWQGACVHLQVSVAAGEKISLKPYFAVKAAETFAMTLLGLLTKGAAI